MKSNERTAKYYDCMVQSFSNRRIPGGHPLPPKSFSDLLTQLQARLAVTQDLRSNRSRTETWHIADISINTAGTKAVILINRSDRLGADQAISDPSAGEFLVAEKEDNQGNASSAHVVILLSPVKPNTYLTVVEEATGISTRDIENLLTQMLNKSRLANPGFFTVNDPSGDPDLAHAARYRFNFVGHPSDDFIAELEAGTIHGIELSDFQSRDQAFDDDGYTVEKKKVIELGVVDTGNSIANFLKSVCRKADSQNFSSIRVKFTDRNEYLRTVEVDARTRRLVNEERFIKKARVAGFVDKLNTGYETINAEIRDKLSALI
jgi:hypothetical protein